MTYTPHIREKFKEAPLRAVSCAILKTLSLIIPITERVKTKHGFEITCIFPDSVSTILYLNGEYEPDLTKTIIENVKQGMTFIDVGAHIGYFSLLASQLVGDAGSVHSFEPNREIFDILLENSGDNMNLQPFALYSEETTLDFYDYGLRFSAYNSLKEKSQFSIKPKTTKARTITLDKYVELMGIKPDFIKIDAEGSEYEILKGAIDTIARFSPLITLEVSPYGEDSKEVAFLTELGYSPTKTLPFEQFGNILWKKGEMK